MRRSAIKKSAKKKPVKAAVHTYQDLLSGITSLLQGARRKASQVINAFIITTYWEIGRRIVEHEQKGVRKAEYGDQLLDRLAEDLSAGLGRGFSRTNVFQMRQFYLVYRQKIQTLSGFSQSAQKIQTLSGQLPSSSLLPLSWSHYVRLISIEDDDARDFYEQEALRGGWSTRQLDRQVSTQFYERAQKAPNKLVVKGQKDDVLSVHEEIRDPFILEFLDLKDEYSESDLEGALIVHLEQFLLELGNDFTFVARQKRLRVGNEWYRIDLLFFHRTLRCLVLIDLKLGKLTHADAGQMNLYLNYAREHWTHTDENPPVGLILSSEKNDAVAHYALGNLLNKVMAREYKLILPAVAKLTSEIRKTRKVLNSQPMKRLDN